MHVLASGDLHCNYDQYFICTESTLYMCNEYFICVVSTLYVISSETLKNERKGKKQKP